MSHVISLKISDAVFHALTETAVQDGQRGSEAQARSVFIRKAIKDRLNKNRWSNDFLKLADADVPEWLANRSEHVSDGAETLK